MIGNKLEIKEVIWIDKKVFNAENQGYKRIIETKYGLKVHQYNNAQLGIEAIKNVKTYSPIFIITSGTIYPEFYQAFKNAVTYIKNLPVQIIFTSNVKLFFSLHQNDEIGRQIGKFYNLGGVTESFAQVENFIAKVIQILRNYKVNCPYTYQRSQDFSGLQTFTYLYESSPLYLPPFFVDVIYGKNIDYKEISIFIQFMLNNFGNQKICDLLKGMVLFNEIPEPILSKFFARAYTLESPFYGIMNQNLMKGNYAYFSTYIKLLYKGLINKSYSPKTDCSLYRGTKLEQFEIRYLIDILNKKKLGQEVPIIYSTSFLSFSTNFITSEQLAWRRVVSPCPVLAQIASIKSISTSTNEMKTNKFPPKVIQPSIEKKLTRDILARISSTKNNKKILSRISSTSNNTPIPISNIMPPPPLINNIIAPNLSSSSLNNEVIIKLNPLREKDKHKIMITNGFLNKISFYHNEDEVLFFPFSAFELVNIYQEGKRTFIVLDYSTRFTSKIKGCIFAEQHFKK